MLFRRIIDEVEPRGHPEETDTSSHIEDGGPAITFNYTSSWKPIHIKEFTIWYKKVYTIIQSNFISKLNLLVKPTLENIIDRIFG